GQAVRRLVGDRLDGTVPAGVCVAGAVRVGVPRRGHVVERVGDLVAGPQVRVLLALRAALQDHIPRTVVPQVLRDLLQAGGLVAGADATGPAAALDAA